MTQGLTDECHDGHHRRCGLLVNVIPGYPSRCLCLCHTSPYVRALRQHAADRLAIVEYERRESTPSLSAAASSTPSIPSPVPDPAIGATSPWSPSSSVTDLEELPF
jgi:hypothetical protein